MAQRYCVLPARGSLLVSTDLHGNGEDFRTLRAIFLANLARDAHARWVLLGDAVHAPDAEARAEQSDLYDFPDESIAIVRGVLELQRRCPDRVHYVLGNHDHGHVGGPPTSKFYADEVAHLEATLDAEGRADLRALFSAALLMVVAPCGALLSHGCPNDSLPALDELEQIPLQVARCTAAQQQVLQTLLTSYGQPPAVMARLLTRLSGNALRLTMCLHGHDRDEEGWFTEGGNQGCPVLFGAPRRNKRYLLLDLMTHYSSVHALREGYEIRRLYPE